MLPAAVDAFDEEYLYGSHFLLDGGMLYTVQVPEVVGIVVMVN